MNLSLFQSDGRSEQYDKIIKTIEGFCQKQKRIDNWWARFPEKLLGSSLYSQREEIALSTSDLNFQHQRREEVLPIRRSKKPRWKGTRTQPKNSFVYPAGTNFIQAEYFRYWLTLKRADWGKLLIRRMIVTSITIHIVDIVNIIYYWCNRLTSTNQVPTKTKLPFSRAN